MAASVVKTQNSVWQTEFSGRLRVAEWLMHSPASLEVTDLRPILGGISEIYLLNRDSLRH